MDGDARHIMRLIVLGMIQGCSATNVDEFLRVREGELVANGGHDRLLACVEICVAMMI